MPLADKFRPTEIDDIVGQGHILGKGKVLRKLIEKRNNTNFIFYGPPGTGKTTIASIIASKTNKAFYKLNGISTNSDEIRKIIAKTNTLEGVNGILLHIDEFHHLNKKVQELILDVIEKGYIQLVASTSENPFFTINKAILSRSVIFEFKPVSNEDIKKALNRIIHVDNRNIICEEGVIDYISDMSSGDVRSAINIMDVVTSIAEKDEKGSLIVKLQDVIDSSTVKIMDYDRDGDKHYDILSAFHKSMRNSDVDASLHYLARLIKSGDMTGIIRRILAFSSEDIGMSSNICVSVNALVNSSLLLGFPEARLTLAHAVVLCATAIKSHSITRAIDLAMEELETKDVGDIPLHLKDAHYKSASKLGRGVGYLYPHNFENHYVKQQCLPNSIKDSVYYIPCDNKYEKAIENYWNKIKNDDIN